MIPKNTIQAKKNDPKKAVERYYDTFRELGAPFTHSGQTYHLQIRDQDEAIWLTHRILAKEAIDAGNGSANYVDPIKTTENTFVQFTNQECFDVMNSAWTYGKAVWGALQSVKAQIETGTITDASQVESAFDTALNQILGS